MSDVSLNWVVLRELQKRPRNDENTSQVFGTRTGANGHMGLGLAIRKAIVDAHGGSIDVFNLPNAGASFTVRLPVAS